MAKHKVKGSKKVSFKMPAHKPMMRMGGVKGKKYFIKDIADRNFKAEIDGFDLVLKAGVFVEVDAKVAKLAKEKFPYLEVFLS